MGKRNKNKRFKNYGYSYRNQHLNQHFYDNFSTNTTSYTAKPEQINKIALEVFGSLHFEVTAQD